MVIRTRSVEYMPFLLSLFNLLNGAVWSGYSIVTRDIFVAVLL
jgi:solute carrier family 50 protein (sugar transporter)